MAICSNTAPMWRFGLAVLVTISSLVSIPALALDTSTWIEENSAPRKVVNIKVGVGLEFLHDNYNNDVISQSPRVVGQFGLQTARKPWFLEAAFYSNVAFEVSAGLFWPTFRVGYGTFAFTAFPYFKATTEKEGAGGGGVLTEVSETFGLGGGIEYLMYTGHLGFFFEVRQTFLEPIATMFVAGVNVSPLLWVLFRNN